MVFDYMKKDIVFTKNKAVDEFELVLNSYILPLFDVKGNLQFVDENKHNHNLIETDTTPDGQLIMYFFPCISDSKNACPFYYKIKTYSTEALKKRAISILRELLKVTEYNYKFLKKQRDYGKNEIDKYAFKIRTFDLAYELGICKWLTVSDSDAYTLYKLICRMIEWTSKTYEGKKVPFGFVIDFGQQNDYDSVDYIHFLQNDSSAVFSDGVFSGIKLDKNGKLISFLTSEHSLESNISRELFVPYQFFSIAAQCCANSIGIIALTNGELMIIKDQAICFSKRGTRWIPFDWERVYSNLRPYFLEDNYSELLQKDIENKIKSIYCSILDVSFAHTGGCLAVVINKCKNEIDNIVKERIDFYKSGNQQSISAESCEKIEVLTHLLADNNNLNSFFKTEKALRKEVLSLDGATVISTNGDFYCVGSIVAVGGGSSGGGRTAATKKLASFGIGIKISEDGYIEAYGKNLYSEKPRIVPLFKIK